jgi:hypothetical protein
MLESLLVQKRQLLDDLLATYQADLADSSAESGKILKYTFGLVALVETAVGVVAVSLHGGEGIVPFVFSVLFLSISVLFVFYERLTMDKDDLRRYAAREREPILQQIALVQDLLTPEE